MNRGTYITIFIVQDSNIINNKIYCIIIYTIGFWKKVNPTYYITDRKINYK